MTKSDSVLLGLIKTLFDKHFKLRMLLFRISREFQAKKEKKKKKIKPWKIAGKKNFG